MLAFALSVASRALGSQGITSAALQGRVIQTDGTPVDGAVVRATATASGAYWQVVTDAAGRYFLENVGVGGPYVIEAKRLGFEPGRRSGIMLALGQRYRATLSSSLRSSAARRTISQTGSAATSRTHRARTHRLRD